MRKRSLARVYLRYYLKFKRLNQYKIDYFNIIFINYSPWWNWYRNTMSPLQPTRFIWITSIVWYPKYDMLKNMKIINYFKKKDRTFKYLKYKFIIIICLFRFIKIESLRSSKLFFMFNNILVLSVRSASILISLVASFYLWLKHV